tara:strand:+ start:2396 stop:2608 length:213 start_codon:yes stop_codon:yes gene_type:complete
MNNETTPTPPPGYEYAGQLNDYQQSQRLLGIVCVDTHWTEPSIWNGMGGGDSDICSAHWHFAKLTEEETP